MKLMVVRKSTIQAQGNKARDTLTLFVFHNFVLFNGIKCYVQLGSNEYRALK